MNMMPAVRLILALVVSAMLFIVRQVREKTDMNVARTLSTTPTIIRARTAWKEPIGHKIHIKRHFNIGSDISKKKNKKSDLLIMSNQQESNRLNPPETMLTDEFDLIM